MGNLGSAPREEEDIWWTNGQRNINENIAQAPSCVGTASCDISLNQLSEKKKQELNDFKFEMERKHEKRREILDAKRKEFENLRKEVQRLREENEALKNEKSQEALSQEIERMQEENDHMRLLISTRQPGSVIMEELDKVLRENTNLRGELKDKIEELEKAATLLQTNRELRINIAEMQTELQNLNRAVLDFEKERDEYTAHVTALKDVISVSKKMLLIREAQLKELREKVEKIEESLSGKEMNILSQDLRMEYERQLQSIRNLRTLYEERQITDHREKQGLKELLEETKKEVESEQNKNKEAEERIAELEELNSQKYDQIKTLESNLGLAKAESRQYQAELTVINQLFSEILLGFNSSQEIDLDKLTRHLEDNHALLQNIVTSESTSESSSALSKVLLDLVHQVHNEAEQKYIGKEEYRDGSKLETIIEESESQTSTDQINSVEEIVELLPKVWRVLIELLSHQKVPVNDIDEHSFDGNPCYKTVQTPKGPSLVLSVSQTFIRLKDLILEKKSLEKETGHLKQLNTHLESRLQDQEKRLEMVSSELNKTWHVVGKLQKEHQLLHTQEKILRYELAQKRKLLSTLREELEYSREKWQEAREKNSKTEKQWKQLRVEFASRRNTLSGEEFSNSQESGYSDERCSSSDDEPGYETDVSECVPKQSEEEVIIYDDETVEDETCKKSNDATTIDDEHTQDLINDQEPSGDTVHSRLDFSDRPNEQSTNEESSNAAEMRDISLSIVSSVIEDAISSILQNSIKNIDVKKKASDQNSEQSPSCSKDRQTKTLEELLAAKEERLKRLEGQCGKLMQQVNSTTQKSVVISNKLDDLHEVYGERSSNQASEETSTELVEERFDVAEGNEEKPLH